MAPCYLASSRVWAFQCRNVDVLSCKLRQADFWTELLGLNLCKLEQASQRFDYLQGKDLSSTATHAAGHKA